MTATTVETICTNLKTIEASIAGVARAFDQMPEACADFPWFGNYPSGGKAGWLSFGLVEHHYTIVAECHVARGMLPEAEKVCRPLINKFIAAVMADSTLSDAVKNVESIDYDYGFGEYGTEKHLVIKFRLDCVDWGDPAAE
jgi:hypothetical protein